MVFDPPSRQIAKTTVWASLDCFQGPVRGKSLKSSNRVEQNKFVFESQCFYVASLSVIIVMCHTYTCYTFHCTVRTCYYFYFTICRFYCDIIM